MIKQKYEKPELMVLELSSDVIMASDMASDDPQPCDTYNCGCYGSLCDEESS